MSTSDKFFWTAVIVVSLGFLLGLTPLSVVGVVLAIIAAIIDIQQGTFFKKDLDKLQKQQ